MPRFCGLNPIVRHSNGAEKESLLSAHGRTPSSPRIAQNRVPVIVKVSVSLRVPFALKILAAPEPLKEFRVELILTPEVPRINAESFPVESKTKFFTPNV